MQNIEDNFKSNGGKFEEFRIGDLFDIRPTKNYGLTNKKLFVTKGNIPVVVNSSYNNGIGGYVDLEPTEQGNIITFSDTTTADCIFYQPRPFVGYSHVQGMFPFLGNWNKGSLQYFVAMFRIITKDRFNYGTKFNRKLVREMKIKLPTQNGEIAFDYMEAYIKELEADRVKELEYEKAQQLKAYLIATGLKDYTLTKPEQTALEVFENSIKINNLTQTGGGKPYLPAVACSQQNTICFKDYQLDKILEWQQGISEINPLHLDILADKEQPKYPFYGQATINNGIISYVSLKESVLNNKHGKPTLLIHSNNQNIAYLQTPFYLKDGHGATSVLQASWLNRYTALYLSSAIGSVIKVRFNYNAKATKIALKNTKIKLPTQNNSIDFDFMHTFIRAIEKIVIKEVVEWADKKIQATKQVIQA